VRVLVCNSGNANAFTGKKGQVAVEEVVASVVQRFSCDPNEVMIASTGVIGLALPFEKITQAVASLALTPHDWHESAKAVMTTDTFPKLAVEYTKIDGKPVCIQGFAKGSGMIEPDMGTMLSFIFTDAKIDHGALQPLLEEACAVSFNAITVDGDTSTSDSAFLVATGQGEAPLITDYADPRLDDFKVALNKLCIDLAQQIVRDGEGASKFISITVKGAETELQAKKIAKSIGNSPLVKTALGGQDGNWGRIVMAVGKSGAKADRDALSIWMGGIQVAALGEIFPYCEDQLKTYLGNQDIDVVVDVGVGHAQATIWTCDLTEEYIEINGRYRS
jgi:glutamate N-acetyltransferase/amino-acid N-acetyltransferase